MDLLETKAQADQSLTIGKLAKALSVVQGVIENALKDGSNPFFKSKYTTLTETWNACRKSLSEAELAVTQTTEPSAEGIILVTTLMHSSGEWIRGKLFMKPVKGDPQAFGSAMSYARRYALSGIVGITSEDDDGERATREAPKKEAAKVETALPKEESFLGITDKQRKAIFGFGIKAGIPAPEIAKALGNFGRPIVKSEMDMVFQGNFQWLFPQMKPQVKLQKTKEIKTPKKDDNMISPDDMPPAPPLPDPDEFDKFMMDN